MSAQLPAASGEQVIRALEAEGWSLKRGRLGAVEHAEHAVSDVEPTLQEIEDERGGDRGVLGRAPQSPSGTFTPSRCRASLRSGGRFPSPGVDSPYVPACSASSPHDLVSFEAPPVGEVVLGLQFSGPSIDLDVLAEFSRLVRSDLPGRERHPVLPPTIETFDVPSAQPTIEFRLEPPAGLPRTWFISQDGSQVLQVQPDRLMLNWRRDFSSGKYPRYQRLRETFAGYAELLMDCFESVGQSADYISLAEVTYINPIDPPGRQPEIGHPPLARVLNRVRRSPPNAFLREPEDSILEARWRIPGEELGVSRPAGRLYLSATPGLKPPKLSPMYVLNLTGRTLPEGGDLDSALQALDVAHRWVVLGFEDVTTKHMHEMWGRRENGSEKT